MTTKRTRRGALTAAILKYIARNPGANATHISEYLSTPVTTALYNLTKQGKVTRRWKSGPVGERGFVYWEVKEQPVAVADLPSTTPDHDDPYARIDDLGATVSELYGRINSQYAEIDELRADVAELEDWKAEAIAKHPDLDTPVDPLVLRAREIVAKHLKDVGFDEDAADTLSGLCDEGMTMCVALDALCAQQTAQDA